MMIYLLNPIRDGDVRYIIQNQSVQNVTHHFLPGRIIQ